MISLSYWVEQNLLARCNPCPSHTILFRHTIVFDLQRAAAHSAEFLSQQLR
jgi:hypothetical protein